MPEFLTRQGTPKIIRIDQQSRTDAGAGLIRQTGVSRTETSGKTETPALNLPVDSHTVPLATRHRLPGTPGAELFKLRL
jgi:hypothetical protein